METYRATVAFAPSVTRPRPPLRVALPSAASPAAALAVVLRALGALGGQLEISALEVVLADADTGAELDPTAKVLLPLLNPGGSDFRLMLQRRGGEAGSGGGRSPAPVASKPAAAVVPVRAPHPAASPAGSREAPSRSAAAAESPDALPRPRTMERQFACPEAGCKYAAATAPALAWHTAKHRGERPLRCVATAVCPFIATDRAVMAAHCASAHTRSPAPQSGSRRPSGDEGRATLLADTDRPAAASAASLKRKRESTAGSPQGGAAGRPFRCAQCPFTSVQAGQLLRHMRSHPTAAGSASPSNKPSPRAATAPRPRAAAPRPNAAGGGRSTKR
jgi:hypothetical protein